MFRSLSHDHHQGSITVLVQFLLIGVHASYDVPFLVVSGYVTRHHKERYFIRTDTPTTYSHRLE
jgi:hypothetical protein